MWGVCSVLFFPVEESQVIYLILFLCLGMVGGFFFFPILLALWCGLHSVLAMPFALFNVLYLLNIYF